MLSSEQRFQLSNLVCHVSSAERDTSAIPQRGTLTHLRISTGSVYRRTCIFLFSFFAIDRYRCSYRIRRIASKLLESVIRNAAPRFNNKKKIDRLGNGIIWDSQIDIKSIGEWIDCKFFCATATWIRKSRDKISRIYRVTGARSRVPLSGALLPRPRCSRKFVDR